MNPMKKIVYKNTHQEINFSILNLIIIKIIVILKYLYETLYLFLNIKISLKILRKLKNTKKDKDILLIANGPSVNRIEIKKLVKMQEVASLETLVMNWSILEMRFKELVPTYIILSDPINIPTNKNFRNIKLWRRIELLISRGTKVILPLNWSHKIDFEKFDKSKFIFFDDRSLYGLSNKILPTHPRGYPSLTAYKALSMAKFLNYRRIYIIGYDASFFTKVKITKNNILIQGGEYFYNRNKKIKAYDNYYKNGISEYFYDLSLQLSSIKRFYGRNIYNLNSDSFIDTFKKISVQEFYKQVNRK
jgi:hypothetical protein